MLDDVNSIIDYLLPNVWTGLCSVRFEKSISSIGIEKYQSSFSFCYNFATGLTYTEGSKLPTTVKRDNCYLTTLLLNGKIKNYLTALGIVEEITEYPEWMTSYNFSDDQQQFAKIREAKEKIEAAGGKRHSDQYPPDSE